MDAALDNGVGAAAVSAAPASGKTCYLGLDVDAREVVVSIHHGHLVPKPSQRWTPDRLIAWVKERVGAGDTVWSVYEACGFGYTLHDQLVGAGACSLVITPMRLSPNGRRRKNDGLDARQLGLRLVRYVGGDRDQLPVMRVPTVEERERRELGRQRAFLGAELRRLENHGRALRLEHEHRTLPAGWWGPRKWKRIASELSPLVHRFLELLREQCAHLHQLQAEMTVELEARVAGDPNPKGLGALTIALVDGEVCDWTRFGNRKQVGSYTGCCPSEASTGGVQKCGSIDKHGNRRVRAMLVEAVWRLLRWQPTWNSAQKFLPRMTLGSAVRKKTVVALARQLAIDLWRWRTGRCTPAELGWELNAPAGEG